MRETARAETALSSEIAELAEAAERNSNSRNSEPVTRKKRQRSELAWPSVPFPINQLTEAVQQLQGIENPLYLSIVTADAMVVPQQ